MRRRTFLATSATAVAALAGCADDGSSDGDGTPTAGMGTDQMDDGTATGTSANDNSLADATIAQDLDAQPRLGPDPMAAESVIVEVTDPSCPTCRSFHAQAFPRIKSELVEPGTTAFVVRNVDWVYSWAPRASASLEAVHDRSPDAYWDLLSFYFETQGEFGSDNVLARTESHLNDAGLDGGSIVSAVENGEYDDAVAADVSVAREAGAQGQPYFFLFKDGSQVTSFSGAQSYDVFRSSLGY